MAGERPDIASWRSSLCNKKVVKLSPIVGRMGYVCGM